MIFWLAFANSLSVCILREAYGRLKSFNKPHQPPVYTVEQINTYPLGVYAVQIITSTSLASTAFIY
jgi:hypothetical protein